MPAATKVNVTPLAGVRVVPEPIGVVWVLGHRGVWRDALRRRLLALADAGAAASVSVTLAVLDPGQLAYAFWSAVFVPAWLVLAKLNGLYDRDHRSPRHLTVDELPRIFTWAMAGTVALTLFMLITPAGGLPAGDALQAGALVAAAGFLLRGAARSVWRHVTPPERTLIIGDGELASATRRKLELFPDMHLRIVGERRGLAVEELREASKALVAADRIIVAAQALDEDLIAELVRFCRHRRIKLSVVPPARGMFGTAVQLNHVADLPFVEYNTWDVSLSTMLLKRILDVALSSAALVLLSPLFLIIAVAVALESRGSVLFVQTRAGADGKTFEMLKFRTMVTNAEELLADLVSFDELSEPMFKLIRDPRVTRVGRLLRRTSLDELPQLLNVLKGDMSLVGPRPEQLELVERYEPEHQFRLMIKPGVTGPMQIYGRGHLTFDERLAVEREYVENISIGRDLRILALTIVPVLTGRGAF